MCVCVYVHMCTYVYIYMGVCVYVHSCVCVCVLCICMYMYTYVYNLSFMTCPLFEGVGPFNPFAMSHSAVPLLEFVLDESDGALVVWIRSISN